MKEGKAIACVQIHVEKGTRKKNKHSVKRVHISLYSVRMRENPGKMRTRITPNTGSFYAVGIICLELINSSVTGTKPISFNLKKKKNKEVLPK